MILDQGVLDLISLEPEALYTVELAAGRGDVDLPASALTGAWRFGC